MWQQHHFSAILVGLLICCSTANGQTAYNANNTGYDYDYADYGQVMPSYQQQPSPDNRNYVPVYQPVPQVPTHSAPEADNLLFVPRYGYVRGISKYDSKRVIRSWLGLKYGVVGTGLARFQRATNFVHSSNVPMDATREPRNCPQFPDLEQIRVDEARGINVDDCLTLNIHAPAQRNGALYPVMVFVHGEMLFDGSAAEGQPDYFMKHDVVLVSVNYRLAPFGFASTRTEQMPGNTALADIHMALEWVQQHIRTFGGNPEQVTLFGQAGGATLVHALAIGGKAQGLFHKLILQSGTALNPYFLDEDTYKTARRLESLANCQITAQGTQNIHNCFERLSTTELLQAFKRLWDQNEMLGLEELGGFKLIVGDYYGYLPKFPAALVANNTYPMMAGVTKDAGAFIMSRFYRELESLRTRNISDYINVVLKHTTQPRHFNIWRNWALQHIFTADDMRNPTLHQLAQGLLELTDLILYRAPILDSIRYTARSYPTYLYCFDYRGEYHRFGHLKNPLPFETDATLSDDNIYLFPYPEEVSRLNANDSQVAHLLTKMWVSFAVSSIPIELAEIWPNVSTEYGPFLRVTNSAALELAPHFSEGIPVPNLYPSYFTTTTTTTTTTTRRPYGNDHFFGTTVPTTRHPYGNDHFFGTTEPTTRRPYGNDYYYGNDYVNREPSVYRPEPVGYRPEPVGYRSEPVGYRPEPTGYRPEPTGYRPPYETVLNEPAPQMPPSNYQQRLAAHAAYNQRMQQLRASAQAMDNSPQHNNMAQPQEH